MPKIFEARLGMIKGFIFDLDGVITDTAELHYLAWNTLAEQQSWKFDRTINERLRGVSRMDSIRIIQKHNRAEFTEDELLKLATLKNEIYVNSLDQISQTTFYPEH